LIVVNGVEAIHADGTHVEVLGKDGHSWGIFSGSKNEVAQEIFHTIENTLIHSNERIS